MADVALSEALIDGTNWQGGSPVLGGSGSPEGVVTAPPGTVYRDVSGGVLYVKQTGTGDAGWAALATVVPAVAHVADATTGSAAEINAIRDALVTLGVMEAAP